MPARYRAFGNGTAASASSTRSLCRRSCPRRIRWPGRSAWALKALRQEPFIGYDEQAFSGRNELIADLCAEAGFAPRFVKYADGLATALTLVGSAAGVVLMPEEAGDLPHPPAMFRPLKNCLARVAFCAATRKGEKRPLVGTVLGEFRLQAQARQR